MRMPLPLGLLSKINVPLICTIYPVTYQELRLKLEESPLLVC
jgi:hypothetical protein